MKGEFNMKSLQKTLSLLLAALLIAASFVGAHAAGGDGRVLLSGTAGSGIVWTLTDDGTLTVSGRGPVKDEVEYEYDDNGEVISSQTLSSIAFTLSEYFDEHTQGMDVAAAERFRFDMVREIVIEEGVTAIPDSEFDGYYPRKVSLPASLTELGYKAFDASFAEEVVIRSDSLQFAQFTIAAYGAGAEPYADIDDAIEGYISRLTAEEQFWKDTMPIFALRELFSIENGLTEATEEEIADTVAYYNGELGTQAATADELGAVALEMVNRRFGTDFADKNEAFSIMESEWGAEIVWSATLSAAYEAASATDGEDGRLIAATLGEKFTEGEKAYGWLKVVAPADSAVEEACKTTGVASADLYEGLCPYCRKDHSANLWQRFVGFIHRILYFFTRLFRRSTS